MNKRTRQYIGLFSAIIAYYVIHEGAHLVYALCIGVFKQINIIGLGMQIDVYVEQMSSEQLGVFCILGSVATTIVAYVLVIAADNNKPPTIFFFSGFAVWYIASAAAGNPKIINGNFPDMNLAAPILNLETFGDASSAKNIFRAPVT